MRAFGGAMSDERPIGIFDSGLGGLCAVRELKSILPHEKIIYFGDTGRVPYGSRSKETIIKYAREDADFLCRSNVKIMLAACGTVSTVALDKIKNEYDVPLLGVAGYAATAATIATKTNRIAVIGTAATIKSGVLEQKIRDIGNYTVVSQACPLFVNLVECGFIGKDCKITRDVCASYLADIKAFGVDTMILGCTHFPIISDIISDYLPGVTLIDPSREAARAIARFLSENDMLATGDGGAEYFVSDDSESFSHLARIFLKGDIDIKAKTITI